MQTRNNTTRRAQDEQVLEPTPTSTDQETRLKNDTDTDHEKDLPPWIQSTVKKLWDSEEKKTTTGSPGEEGYTPKMSETVSMDCHTPSRAGTNALSIIARRSTRIPTKSVKALSLVLNSTELRVTDPAIFTAYEKKIFAPEHLFEKWTKDNAFKDRSKNYLKAFQEKEGLTLRSVMESFLEFIITQKQTSIELATQALVYFSTPKIRSDTSLQTFVSERRETQILDVVTIFLKTADGDMDHFSESMRKQQDHTRVIDIDLSQAQMNEIPGLCRLGSRNEDTRFHSWTQLAIAIIDYLCGQVQKNSIDVKTIKASYFVPSDRKKSHGLRQQVIEGGRLQSIQEIFKAEEQLYQHLQEVEQILQTGQLLVTDFSRIKNMIRAVHPHVKTKMLYIFSMAATDHELIDDTPDMPWTDFKMLLAEACKVCEKDVDQIKERRSEFKQSDTQDTKGQNQNSETSKQQKNGKCRICKEHDHATKDCPKRSGQVCTFWERYGHCNFGESCRWEHPAKSGAPGEDNTNNDSSQEPDEKIIKECHLKIHSDCTGKFEESKTYWEKILLEHPDWSMPKSCQKCRQQKKEQEAKKKSANMMTGVSTESDSDELDLEDEELMYGICMMTTENQSEQFTPSVESNSDFQTDLTRSLNIQ